VDAGEAQSGAIQTSVFFQAAMFSLEDALGCILIANQEYCMDCSICIY